MSGELRQNLATEPCEIDQSEIIFVRRSSTSLQEPYSIRSFTPYAEEPFCGHGILAAAICLAQSCPAASFVFRTEDGFKVTAHQTTSNHSVIGQVEYGVQYRMTLELPAVPVNE